MLILIFCIGEISLSDTGLRYWVRSSRLFSPFLFDRTFDWSIGRITLQQN